jgi:iron complex outermembrane receptor protein
MRGKKSAQHSTRPATHISTLAAVIALHGALLAVSPAAHAQSAAAQVAVDVPAQPLGQALTALGRQLGVQIVASSDRVAGKTSAAVKGRLTADAALSQLLSGTGLAAEPRGDSNFAIIPVPASASNPGANGELAPVKVVSARDNEVAGGHVDGFVARRSTSATKTDTPLLETPQSVSVITRDQLDARGVQNLESAISYTPGIVGGSYGVDTRSDWLTLRGFVPAKYLDGMELPNGVFAQPRLETYGLERIDVLRGPSSALYGLIPPGGMIDMISRKPTADMVNEVGLQAGNFGRYQGQFDIGGAIDADGKYLYRLTGLARNSGTQTDYIKDRRVFLAPSFTWNPTPDTSLTVLAQYQKDTPGTSSQFLPSQGTLLANPFGPIPVGRDVGEPGWESYHRTYASLGYLLAHRFNDVWQFRQNVRFAQVNVDYHSVYGAGFVKGADGLPTDYRTINRYAYLVQDRANSLTVDNQVEGKFVTGPLQHDLLMGFDYKRSQDNYGWGFGSAPTLDVYAPVYGALITTPALSYHTRQVQNQFGVYAQDQVKFQRWVFTASVRHDWVDTATTDYIAGMDQPSQADHRFSGRVGVNYVFDGGISPYVAFSQSFQPTIGAGFNGQRFAPTTGKQVETGIKYQPPGRNMTFTAAVYQLVQENALSSDPAHIGFSTQTGEVRVRGIELEANAEITHNLNLLASYTYTNSDVTKSSDPTQLGKQLALVPRQQASAWLDYTMHSGPLAGFGLGGGVRYVGATYGDAANVWRTPSYTLFDASAHYQMKNWKFVLNVNNLFDRNYVPTCNTGDMCYWGDRRTIIGTATYQW